MKTLAYIFISVFLMLPKSSKATSITALENLNLSSSSLENQIGEPASRTSYAKALRSYLGQSENSCSRSEEIFGQAGDVTERLPGFSKRLWSQSNTESFAVGEYKIQKVTRPFNAFMLFGHPSFCAKKTCDAKDQLLVEQWTMAVAGTSLYLIEKKGKYTGAQIALIPVVEGKNNYTLLVTTDPLKHLQKQIGERELLSLVTQAITTGKPKLGKLALLKQIPGSSRYQVMEMLKGGVEGPELAPLNQFHLNDPMVPNLLSMVEKNCLEPNKKGLAKKPKSPATAAAGPATVPAPGSVNVSVGGAGGEEAKAGDKNSTTNNYSNNNSNSNNSKKTIASQEESLQPGSFGSDFGGNNNSPEGLVSGANNSPGNIIPGLDTYDTVNPGTNSQDGTNLPSSNNSISNGNLGSNINESQNRSASRNSPRNSGSGSNGFSSGGPSGILGSGGFLPGRTPSSVGGGSNSGNSNSGSSSIENKSSKATEPSTPQKYSSEDETLKHKMARALAELDSKGKVPEHMIMDFANALEASKNPELKAKGQKEFHRLYYKNQDDEATFRAMVNLSEKLPLFSDRLEKGLTEDMCFFCKDCPGCIGKGKSSKTEGGS